MPVQRTSFRRFIAALALVLALAPHTSAAPDNPKEKPDASAHTPPLTPAKRGGIAERILGTAAPNAAFTPDPATKPAAPAGDQPVVVTGATGDFFEQIDALFFAATPKASIAAVVFQERDAEKSPTPVERLDLTTGASLGVCTIPVPVKALDLSPDGHTLLAHSRAPGFDTADRLDLWSLDGPDATHVLSFKPYDDRKSHDVTWAQFVGAEGNRIATLNSEGRLVVWDLKGGALWAAQAETAAGGLAARLSPGRKQIVVPVKEGIAIVDAVTGRTLKTLKTPGLFASHYGLSPDGARFGYASGFTAEGFVWDLKTGKETAAFTAVSAAGKTIDLIGDNYALLGREYLIALDKQIVLWRYEHERYDARAAGWYDGRLWYVAPTGNGEGAKPALASATLPDPAAEAALKNLDLAALAVIHPGEAVTLDVSNLPDDIRQKTTAGLTKNLAERGIRVADGQPNRFVATTEPGETHQVQMHEMFGPRGGPFAKPATKVDVTALKWKLALVDANGKELWKQQGANLGPGIVNIKKDQSPQDAVNEVMRPRAETFTGIKFPQVFLRAGDNAGFGSSKLTAQGATPTK